MTVRIDKKSKMLSKFFHSLISHSH